jgi:hypothetical protein
VGEVCTQLDGAAAVRALNAPRHHAAILTAFAEVCTQLAGAAAASPPPHQPPAFCDRSVDLQMLGSGAAMPSPRLLKLA